MTTITMLLRDHTATVTAEDTASNTQISSKWSPDLKASNGKSIDSFQSKQCKNRRLISQRKHTTSVQHELIQPVTVVANSKSRKLLPNGTTSECSSTLPFSRFHTTYLP